MVTPVRLSPVMTFPRESPFDFKRWVQLVTEHIDGQDGWKSVYKTLSVHGTGGNDPAFGQIAATNFYAFNFANGGTQPKQCWDYIEIPHDYKFNTKVYLTVHWCPSDATAGNVIWNINYTYADSHSQAAFNYASPTTVQITQAASGTAYTNMIATLTEAQSLDGETLGLEPNGLIALRLYRDSSLAGDTYAGDAFVSGIGMHYQTDGRVTMVKSPNWLKFGTLR